MLPAPVLQAPSIFSEASPGRTGLVRMAVSRGQSI